MHQHCDCAPKGTIFESWCKHEHPLFYDISITSKSFPRKEFKNVLYSLHRFSLLKRLEYLFSYNELSFLRKKAITLSSWSIRVSLECDAVRRKPHYVCNFCLYQVLNSTWLKHAVLYARLRIEDMILQTSSCSRSKDVMKLVYEIIDCL